MKMLQAFVRAVWTICKKDVRVWLRQPANVAITVLPALALLFVDALSAGAGGRCRVGPGALGQGVGGPHGGVGMHPAGALFEGLAAPVPAPARLPQQQGGASFVPPSV